MNERRNPPREIWLALADLAKVPAEEREAGAQAFAEVWDTTAAMYPRPLPELENPDPGVLRDLAAALEKASAAMEALPPGERFALAIECHLAPREVAHRITEYAEFGRLLAAGAVRIAPRSSPSGKSRPPERIRRRVSAAEVMTMREYGDDTNTKAGDEIEVLSKEEALLLGLARAALEHGGRFTSDRRCAEPGGGTIIEAWRRLERFMPTGFALPKRARNRIDTLLCDLRRAHPPRSSTTE